MGIETWKVFPSNLKHFAQDGIPLPCSDQNPRLKCRETRWARDYCLAEGGSCEYKIEAHFDCLEQHYPKEKVEQLRKNFHSGTLDYPTSDIYQRYAQFYSTFSWKGKKHWDRVW